MLYGAIIGDISGSRYEFNNIKYKPKYIMDEKCFFTDDTVITIAIADALLSYPYQFENKMKKWGNLYPNAGYGATFFAWLREIIKEPYNSFGNGSAMRVSPVAYVGKDLEEVQELAKLTACITHNHPEGIKGAIATASAIYLAKEGYSKEYIKQYIIDYADYKIESCDTIRLNYSFDETCQGTIPQAISAFLESNSFSNCIRLAISLGGDSDTIAAIAGSIAEAFYGVPEVFKKRCRYFLPNDMLSVIDSFENKYNCIL